MSIRVNLFEFSKRSNSTLRPSGNGYIADCELHAPFDVMAPVLLFNLSAPFASNYMYVQDWDRYYWIDSWTYDKGLWHAQCSIDALASWRNSIGNMTEYILRSSSVFNGSIVDTVYPLTAETETTRTDMAGWSIQSTATGCYVVGIVGGNGLVEYYMITDIANFGAYMFGDDNAHPLWDNVIADDPGRQEGGYASFMKAQFNPLQYVVSCMWYPFTIPHANTTSSVKFGYFDSGLNAYKITRNAYQLFSGHIDPPDHPQDSRGSYLNVAPYTRLRLSALPWGEIDLDTTKFQGPIYLEAWVDPVTGSSKLYVSNYDDIILTLVGQIGVPEQLSQVLKDNLATVTGGLSAVAGLASMFTGNVTGGLATAASGIGSALAAQYPDVSTTGTNGARIAVCPTKIWLTTTHQYIVGEDRPNHGRPLCERRKISSIPGYMVIAEPDVEIPATKAEIDKIKEFMTNGFFYE